MPIVLVLSWVCRARFAMWTDSAMSRQAMGQSLPCQDRPWSVTAISGQAVVSHGHFRTGHGQSWPFQDRPWVSHCHVRAGHGHSWPCQDRPWVSHGYVGAGHGSLMAVLGQAMGQSLPFRAGRRLATAISVWSRG